MAQTAKDCQKAWKEQYHPQLSLQVTAAEATQWWLQALDDRLHEIRTYHAAHAAAVHLRPATTTTR